MKITLFWLLAMFGFPAFSQTTLTIMDSVIFYDGYGKTVTEQTRENVVRLRNDLYTKKLTDEQLSAIGSTLELNVLISALCDNYDRLGNVSLAFVPKGLGSYNTQEVQKVEIARFITPFMNKNVSPTSAPYSFRIDNVAAILRSEELKKTYDFWLEFEVFGVPYAANKEVAGCSGRSDVFMGKIDLVTDDKKTAENSPALVLKPLIFKADFNDYKPGCSDTIGKTVKTVTFTLDEPVQAAKIYLITSNHGANDPGEEYIRRKHIVAFDGKEVLTYVPGGKSCEPLRSRNTQGNGIYGRKPMTDEEWLSFNNWCPGDVIPTREILLGQLEAGTHTFVISIPDAVFAEDQGSFPLTVYLQGTKAKKKGRRSSRS